MARDARRSGTHLPPEALGGSPPGTEGREGAASSRTPTGTADASIPHAGSDVPLPVWWHIEEHLHCVSVLVTTPLGPPVLLLRAVLDLGLGRVCRSRFHCTRKCRFQGKTHFYTSSSFTLELPIVGLSLVLLLFHLLLMVIFLQGTLDLCAAVKQFRDRPYYTSWCCLYCWCSSARQPASS